MMSKTRIVSYGFLFLIFLLSFTTNLYQDVEIRHYIETKCQIVDKQESRDIDKYKPLIDVNYQVNGQNYSASAPPYHAYPKQRFEFIAKYFLANYTVNSTIPCWYNPNDPQQVILEKNYHYAEMIFIIDVICFALGLGFMTSLNSRPISVPKSAPGDEPIKIVRHKYTVDYIYTSSEPLTEAQLPPELKKRSPQLRANYIRLMMKNGRYVQLIPPLQNLAMSIMFIICVSTIAVVAVLMSIT